MTTMATMMATTTDVHVMYAVAHLHDGTVAAFSGRNDLQVKTLDDPISRRALQAVVDAEEQNLLLLQEVVHHLGYDADGSSSAQEALQKIADGHYDLIITDMHLPAMDGLSLYQQIREVRPELAQWVIFISDRLLSDEIGMFFGRVGCPFIKKPFSVADIEMGMQRALGVSMG